MNGFFKLTVENTGGVLEFTYIGFEHKEIAIGSERTINVQLSELSTNLNEVMVVGYGVQKKTSLTSSVADVKGTELTKAPVPNISNSLAGRAPGIVARPNGGVPGQDNANIYVRGK
ncbi:hypothetical protein [Mucilaginibacter pallidiroseus]|uniref:hypothetical protein n=1 Tax=Mucilaginibacter pallidiroseus TaxID=2599295 RepID=UPI0021BD3B4E|nr:hypothetical protein [Mucilaginibacter pallidiroseus]